MIQVAAERPLALYPGCSLLSTGGAYLASVHETLRALGLQVKELPDWNCCGASSAHFVDPELAVLLPARNLAIAEALGADVLTACAACHHRLVQAEHEMSTSEAMARAAAEQGVAYHGGVRVRHLLSVLDETDLSGRIRRPLKGLRVACYYGCLLVRIPRSGGIDDPEDPGIMERVLGACGAEVADWQGKTWCCGASLAATAPELAGDLVQRILVQAHRAGADCIATACPLCQLNLDLLQGAAAERAGFDRLLPVVFFTQLTALALGASPRRLGFGKHLVAVRPMMAALAG